MCASTGCSLCVLVRVWLSVCGYQALRAVHHCAPSESCTRESPSLLILVVCLLASRPGVARLTKQMCRPRHRLVQIAESLCKQAQQVLSWLKDTALISGHWAAAPQRQAEPSAECQVSVPCQLQLQAGAVCLHLTA